MKKYVLGPNAARKLKALLAKSDGVSRRPAGSAAVVSDLEYAAPFTVQWAASVGSGGAWIIWLPSDSLLIVNGETVDFMSDLEAAGGSYPDGWYVLDCIDESSGGSLYLNVHVPKPSDDESGDDVETADVGDDADDDPEVTASFGSEPDEAEDGEIVYPVLIAVCDGFTVKQNVLSSITIGGADGGDVECVTSLNEETGDVSIIGGAHIVVETNGRTIKVSYDEEKEEDDDDPNEESNPCDHPGEGGGGGVFAGLGGGGGGVSGGADDGSAGCKDCGGSGSSPGEGAQAGGKAGTSTAPDGKGAADGTVVSEGSSGNVQTGTSAKGKPISSSDIRSFANNDKRSTGGRKITDGDIRSFSNGDARSTGGKKIGDGDIRSFANGDARSENAKRIGVTPDIHGFVNNDTRSTGGKKIGQ